MTHSRKLALTAVVGLAFTFAPLTASALDPAPKCEAGKLKVAGKYGARRLSAESKAVKKGGLPDYSKCVVKFGDKWQKSEDKAGPGVCPSEGDQGDIDSRIIDHADAIALLLSGATTSAG